MIIKKNRHVAFIFIVGLFVGLGLLITGCVNDKPISIMHEYFQVNYYAAEGGSLQVGENPNNTVKDREYTNIPYDHDVVEKITAVPDEGYYFVKWSDGLTEFARHDKFITNSLDVTAEFAPITDSITVVYSVKGNGMILGKSTQTIQRGTEAQPVEARRSGGLSTFIHWSDGLDSPIRQDTKVTDNIEITAVFGYPINYNVIGEGAIIGNANQVVVFGQDAETVTALPNQGYRFVKWSDGVKTATRTDKMVMKDFNVYAIFEWRDADTFIYNYEFATDNCYEDGLELTRGEVVGKTAVVPTRGEFFTFDGWYLDEEFAQKAFDENGNGLLGESIFNSPSRDLYAKWEVIEKYVTSYKILMVYVTQIDGTFIDNYGQNIAVHYTMPEELQLQCIELTKRFSDTLNEMLDGLVNFDIDSYFTTKSVNESCFTNEEYNTYILANQIPELKNNGTLDDYRSVLTMYSFGNEKSLFPSWAGIGGEKYAAIPIDEPIRLSGNSWKEVEYYGGIVSTCVHEFIHTLEFGITCYSYHRAYNPAVPRWVLDKLFLLNQFPVDFYIKLCDNPELWKKEYFMEAWRNSPKAGIPYGIWTNEIFDVIVKPECNNGRPDGYGGDGTIDTGGMVAKYSNQSKECDWWYDNGGAGYIQRVPKGSRTTLLLAEAKPGYLFLGWSDGVKDELRVLSDVQEDITLIAYFERLSYTIEYIAGEGGRIEGKTIQNVLTGDYTEWVTAVPDEGYRFVEWSDNNQGYFNSSYDKRRDTPGFNIYDESGEFVQRLGFTVTAIFEKIDT